MMINSNNNIWLNNNQLKSRCRKMPFHHFNEEVEKKLKLDKKKVLNIDKNNF